MTTDDFSEANFWIVSPNVNSKNWLVPEWEKASIEIGAAFMGYGPAENAIGERFANTIREGDVVLIARRRQWKPHIVGAWVVQGKHLTRLQNFSPPGQLGSLRMLNPFIKFESFPSGLNILEALRHTVSLRRLNPEDRPNEEKICLYLLGILRKSKTNKLKLASTPNRSSTKPLLPSPSGLEYRFRTKAKIIRARKIEERLVLAYKAWLIRKDRHLTVENLGLLKCDAFENANKNLIEAKASIRREHIRMALGQLLDYSQLLHVKHGSVYPAILLPRKPDLTTYSWLSDLGVSLVWQENKKFKDNCEGRFV